MMMASVEKIIAHMRNNPQNIKFQDLKKICEFYFGSSKQNGSHIVFKCKIPPYGLSIQSDKGKAKKYQVQQILKIIDEINRKD